VRHPTTRPSALATRTNASLRVGRAKSQRHASRQEEPADWALEAAEAEVGPARRELSLEPQAEELEELRNLVAAETADLDRHDS
jgi:hypothetical protein